MSLFGSVWVWFITISKQVVPRFINPIGKRKRNVAKLGVYLHMLVKTGCAVVLKMSGGQSPTSVTLGYV